MSGPTPESAFATWLESCQSVQKPDDKRIDVLRGESREIFVASSDNEISLAKLLQSLGPGLTGRLPSRLYALNIICGALEGSQQQKSQLTLATASVLRDFLLEQCGPIKEEEDTWGEDYAERIRDTSIKCLSSLLGCRLDNKPNLATEIVQACTFYSVSARTAVTRRCALPEDSDGNMPDSFRNPDVTNGLSTLPRSRRSLCFGLIQSAVISLQARFETTSQDQLATMATMLESEVNTFVTFACTCMQGESDPRCLMEMLLLLNKIQEAFEPLFRAGKLSSFPIVTMFDAVAPYYPINFTPPPNDSHGITRKGLNDALMAVLRYSKYDRIIPSSLTLTRDTMTSLSLGLALERLVPMDGDNSNVAPSASERSEALDDLYSILFPGGIAASLDCLHDGSVQQLSNALIITHHEAAVAVLLGGPDVNDDKQLADSCRSLVARIATSLEAAKDKQMWTMFVKDSVARMTDDLGSRQQESRIAIAYLAALVTSGAPQTIQLVLDATVDKLIHLLNYYSSDEERATLGAFGIGAIFSAAKVAEDKARAEGLVTYPHSVDSFCSQAFQALLKIYSESSASDPLKTASVYALDAVLRVTSANTFEDQEKVLVGDFVSHLAAHVLKATNMEDSEREATTFEFAKACAEALGGLLGTSMAQENSQHDVLPQDNVLRTKQVLGVLKRSVLVDLLFSSRKRSKAGGALRFDRVALARACSTSLAAASSSIESLLHALRDSLSGNFDPQESVECARALSYVLRQGGRVAVRAFHELSAAGVTVHEVLPLLGDLDQRRTNGDNEKKISNLDLPPPVEVTQASQKMMRKIVILMLPAYTIWVPTEEVVKMLSLVSNLLPPLSSVDVNKLYCLLPLLAAALKYGNLPPRPLANDANKLSFSTCSELTNFALTTEYEPQSRCAAADCLRAYILNNFADIDHTPCTAKRLLVEVVIPSLISASKDVQPATKEESSTSDIGLCKLVDCLKICSTLGSAAASTGGMSAATADEVAKFFIELACFKKALIPFAESFNYTLDLTKMGPSSSIIAMAAVESFGSLLCYGKNPLWVQRQSHKTLKLLEPTIKLGCESETKAPADDLCFIAVLGHIVCSGNVKRMNSSDRGALVKLFVNCLVSGVDDGMLAIETSKVKRLVVASILKMSHLFPGLLSNHIEGLFVGLLRAFAGAASSDPISDVSCKLLILEVMESLCHIDIRKKALLSIKPALNSILSASMNHPSRALREASVRVQNTWYTLA